MSNPGPAITSSPLLDQVGLNINPSAAASGDGDQLGLSSASLVGFWGAVPAAQPASAAGNIHTVVAGAGATVHVDSSFDGSVGSKAYTIGDIIANLKACGILAP
jgi:hypothetical protein